MLNILSLSQRGMAGCTIIAKCLLVALIVYNIYVPMYILMPHGRLAITCMYYVCAKNVVTLYLLGIFLMVWLECKIVDKCMVHVAIFC